MKVISEWEAFRNDSLVGGQGKGDVALQLQDSMRLKSVQLLQSRQDMYLCLSLQQLHMQKP
jgi:hypothetical protein